MCLSYLVACGGNEDPFQLNAIPTESPESAPEPTPEPTKDATLIGFYTLIRYDATGTDSAELVEDSGESTLFIYIEFRNDGTAFFFFIDEGEDVTYKVSGNQVILIFDVDDEDNELVGIIEGDTITFEQDGLVMVYKLNPEFETDGTPAVTHNYISEEEARGLLQAWIDTHPFQLGSNLEPGRDDHIVDGVEYYRFYLGIVRFGIAEVLVHKDTGELFHFSSLGNSTFEPLDDWYIRDHVTSAPKIVTYGGKPVTPLLGKTPDDVINVFGAPESSSHDDRNVIINIAYEDILLWFDNGLFTFLENYNPGALEVDGISLDKNRSTLIGLLGEPDYEDWGEGAYGAEDVYIMNYLLQNYRIYFEFWDGTEEPPYMVLINSR